ncbi:hypothetical protein E4582_01835 [Luteimonas yindakuii]|uniref:SURF1-like protein n=1 Tax=Luteimonas yindakuii TaxID=2565782 RepID=A0A4Z1R3Z6_9GAMM|nr:hypothetical protein [Luteimonas yindakuii]TKS53636.1 hypothetical protein E4582_01835 [Luteimonas yindakuii]
MRLACLLLLLPVVGPALAQAQVPDAQAQPQPVERLVDPEFGISSDGYALRRDVQMLQWVPDTRGDRLDWRDAAVPTGGLDAAHRNPPALPFVAVEWQANARLPDGRVIPHDVIVQAGEWQLLHPEPALLPPNLAATFQPSGEVLTTAADPQSPQPGDLRLRWSELVLPDATGFMFDAGRWVPVPTRGRALDAPAIPEPAHAAVDASGTGGNSWRYWLAAVLLLALVAGLAWRQRGRR